MQEGPEIQRERPQAAGVAGECGMVDAAGCQERGEPEDEPVLRADLTREMWTAATADGSQRLCLPDVDERALSGLKFSEALPEHLAYATLSARLADIESAVTVLREPVRFVAADPLSS
jgi:hypothetical protein